MKFRAGFAVALGWLAMSLTQAAAPSQAALDSITSQKLLRDIQVLASDEFEGRGPGTRGEERTTAWLVDQFKAAGLQPGGPNRSWFQSVPMMGIRSSVTATLQLGKQTETLIQPQDIVAWAPPQRPRVSVENSPLVFVGYGVEAPEYGWDDYKGVDVRGKTLLMLVNDPQVEDSTGQLDPQVFKGKAMTYYGRWTYKYEIAARKGAAAAWIIHETGPAGYPWFVVVNSWSRENFSLIQTNQDTVQIAGWLSLDASRRLLQSQGLDLADLKRQALRRDFRPRELPITVQMAATNVLRPIISRNVVGELRGSERKRRDEWILYTAHWDHLGRDDQRQGDPIFNGALDNATGTSGLLELARAFTQLRHKPARSLLFLALTGEEQGLLGARYYASNPLHPLAKTVANINMDGLNPWGKTQDMAVIGLGNSTLDDLIQKYATQQGRVLNQEAHPEKGYFYRSDHFEFAKVGIPALYAKSGTNYVDRPLGWGQSKADEYTERDYHKVSDEVKSDWDFSGAVQDLQLLFRVGYELSTTGIWPEWKPGAEFKAIREQSLKKP